MDIQVGEGLVTVRRGPADAAARVELQESGDGEYWANFAGGEFLDPGPAVQTWRTPDREERRYRVRVTPATGGPGITVPLPGTTRREAP